VKAVLGFVLSVGLLLVVIPVVWLIAAILTTMCSGAMRAVGLGGCS
jgi:hypothetical protein